MMYIAIGLMSLIILIIVIGLSHILYVYRDYKSLIYDTITVNKGTQVGTFKKVQELYKEHIQIFTVSNRDKKTLQTHWLYDKFDCYLNTYYIVIYGYSIYLHRFDYIKYWFWINFITRKHRRKH